MATTFAQVPEVQHAFDGKRLVDILGCATTADLETSSLDTHPDIIQALRYPKECENMVGVVITGVGADWNPFALIETIRLFEKKAQVTVDPDYLDQVLQMEKDQPDGKIPLELKFNRVQGAIFVPFAVLSATPVTGVVNITISELNNQTQSPESFTRKLHLNYISQEQLVVYQAKKSETMICLRGASDTPTERGIQIQVLNAWLKLSGVNGFVITRNFAYLCGKRVKKWLTFVGYQIIASSVNYSWGSVMSKLQLKIPVDGMVVQHLGPYSFEVFQSRSKFATECENHLLDEALLTSPVSVQMEGLPAEMEHVFQEHETLRHIISVFDLNPGGKRYSPDDWTLQ